MIQRIMFIKCNEIFLSTSQCDVIYLHIDCCALFQARPKPSDFSIDFTFIIHTHDLIRVPSHKIGTRRSAKPKVFISQSIVRFRFCYVSSFKECSRVTKFFSLKYMYGPKLMNNKEIEFRCKWVCHPFSPLFSPSPLTQCQTITG